LLEPADLPGEQGDEVALTNSGLTDLVIRGTALSFLNSTEIYIEEVGYYQITWEVFLSGYDSAFALFYDAGAGPVMVPGSNYGAMAHDEKYGGQTISYFDEAGILTLNRIDDNNYQIILNQIGGGTFVTGASIIVMKIG